MTVGEVFLRFFEPIAANRSGIKMQLRILHQFLNTLIDSISV